jgi:hypothetical protein
VRQTAFRQAGYACAGPWTFGSQSLGPDTVRLGALAWHDCQVTLRCLTHPWYRKDVTFGAITLLLVVAVAGCSVQSDTGASRTTTSISATKSVPTNLEFYSPWTFDGTLKPSVRVAKTLSDGSCWTTSIADPDENNAWRCMSGDSIYDPCFTPELIPDTREVACVDTPWSAVLMLKLSAPVPYKTMGGNNPPDNPHPWYLVLSNGARCEVTQHWGESSGVPLPYGCRAGRASYPVETMQKQWALRYVANGSKTLAKVHVVTAWV